MKFKLVSLITATGISIGIASVVHAFVPFQAGYVSSSFSVKNSDLNQTYFTALEQAVLSWNSTPTSALVSLSNTSSNLVFAVSNDYSWYGYYTRAESDSYGNATKFLIEINAKRILKDAENGVSVVNTPRSTIAHELGHALHLDDLNSGSSLMSHSRKREEIYIPQQDDIDGVNAWW